MVEGASKTKIWFANQKRKMIALIQHFICLIKSTFSNLTSSHIKIKCFVIVHLYQTNHNNLVFGNKNTDSSRSYIILCPQDQNNRNFKWKFPSCFDLLWRFCEDFSNHMERFLSQKAQLCESKTTEGRSKSATNGHNFWKKQHIILKFKRPQSLAPSPF